MKPNKLTSLVLGGFITLFGGLNSTNAQEIQDIYPHVKKAGEIIYAANDGEVEKPWQTSEETIKRDSGNCVDKSILIKDKLDSIGIETKLVVGKYKPESEDRHMWIQAKIREKDYIIECSGKGIIYDKDSIKNLEDGPRYLYSNLDSKGRIRNQIEQHYNKTGEILDIKGFEYLQKIIPLSTSPEFSSYFSDSTFLKTLPKKK